MRELRERWPQTKSCGAWLIERLPGLVHEHFRGLVHEHLRGLVHEHLRGLVHEHFRGLVHEHLRGLVHEHFRGLVHWSLRGAISLAPWLQPGDHKLTKSLPNRFNGLPPLTVDFNVSAVYLSLQHREQFRTIATLSFAATGNDPRGCRAKW